MFFVTKLVASAPPSAAALNVPFNGVPFNAHSPACSTFAKPTEVTSQKKAKQPRQYLNEQ